MTSMSYVMESRRFAFLTCASCLSSAKAELNTGSELWRRENQFDSVVVVHIGCHRSSTAGDG